MSSYLAQKIGYINKRYTHTQSRTENSIFQFCLTITKPFPPIYLEELSTVFLTWFTREFAETVQFHRAGRSTLSD